MKLMSLNRATVGRPGVGLLSILYCSRQWGHNNSQMSRGRPRTGPQPKTAVQTLWEKIAETPK